MSSKPLKLNLINNQLVTYGLVVVLIIGAFIIGNLWTRVQYLEDNKGATAANTGNSPQVPTPAPAPTVNYDDIDPITSDDFVRGNRDARIALIEYSDLECPFCKRFHPTAQQLINEYPNDVMWVYRHFPLDELHSKARAEALAAECAGNLGGEKAFWSYIDKIYEVTPANNGLDLSQLPAFAQQIGLNQSAFNKCFDAEELASKVEADYQSGIKAGVRGTPGNIILDLKNQKIQVIPGAVPYEQLKVVVDQLLAS